MDTAPARPSFLRQFASAWLSGILWAATVVLVAFLPAYLAAHPPILDGATQPTHPHTFKLKPASPSHAGH